MSHHVHIRSFDAQPLFLPWRCLKLELDLQDFPDRVLDIVQRLFSSGPLRPTAWESGTADGESLLCFNENYAVGHGCYIAQ